MKKYLTLLPVIIYPYAYIIGIGFLLLLLLIPEDIMDGQTMIDVFCYGILIYHIFTLIFAVYGVVLAAGIAILPKKLLK